MKKELTKAEEQIMHILWKIEKGFVKDIVDNFTGPKPAYTTVTTIIRILVKKKFIAFNTYGKVHEYFPIVDKSDYMKDHMKEIVRKFFSSNNSGFVSFFTRENDLSIKELESIRKIIDEEIREKKSKDE
jgi:predicted transcriptional regulator